MALVPYEDQLRAVTKDAIKINEPLANHTTFGIGGPADALVCPKDMATTVRILSVAAGHDIPCHILGRGSNLLVADSGVRGLVVKTTDVAWHPPLQPIAGLSNQYEAGGGVPISVLLAHCLKKQLTGLEPLTGIPGTLGGAIAMNAGTQNGTVSEVVERVCAFDLTDGTLRQFSRTACEFGYRSSRFLQGHRLVVLSAQLHLGPADRDDIATYMREQVLTRRASQPWRSRSAGSVFRNPPGDSAGHLIEKAGWKGCRVGGAEVSLEHANFIVNVGHASAADVMTLIRRIKASIKRQFGVELELELRIWGADAP